MILKSNIYSNPFARRCAAALVLLIVILIAAGCNRSTPSPTAQPVPTQAPSQAASLEPTQVVSDTSAPATEAPASIPTRTPPASVPSTRPVSTDTSEPQPQAQPTTARATATPRPSSTPKPSNYVFPTDESGFPVYPTDAEGNEYFPTDVSGNPIIATDESGFPIFPIDAEGNFLIPKNVQGTPLYATDEFGFPIIEVTDDETIPTDEFATEEVFTDETQVVEDTTQPGGTPNPTSTRRPVPTSQPRSTTTGNDNFQEPEPSTSGLLAHTPITWATPVTNQPLGTEENPLYIGIVVVREDDLVRADAMDALAQRLSDDTGLVIRARRTGSYAELLNGMRAGGVHFAWLQPFTYIVAHQRGYADVLLISNHLGLEAYGTMFLANKSHDFSPSFDPIANKSTAAASEALLQFADMKPCFVDPMSASGYIAASGLLAQNNVPVREPVFLNSHAAVVRALYIQGICDFGVTFGISGDPRTASVIQQSLPDVMDKVEIIWQSDPIIPSLNFSVAPRLSEDLRVKVIEALVDLVQTDEGKQMLTDANAYDIRGLKEIDDSFYQTLRDLLNKSGVNSRTLLGK